MTSPARCASCGEPLPPNATACPTCGADVAYVAAEHTGGTGGEHTGGSGG